MARTLVFSIALLAFEVLLTAIAKVMLCSILLAMYFDQMLGEVLVVVGRPVAALVTARERLSSHV